VEWLVLLKEPKETILVLFNDLVNLLDVGLEINYKLLARVLKLRPFKFLPVNGGHLICCKLDVEDLGMLPNIEFLFSFVIDERLFRRFSFIECGWLPFCDTINISQIIIRLWCSSHTVISTMALFLVGVKTLLFRHILEF
jgi:hypothetical protein